jgi:ribonuclease HI
MDTSAPIAIVRVFVRTDDGHFLLLRRAKNDRWAPGRYELPGGKVDFEDVDLLTAAQREIAEETGLHLAANDLQLCRVFTDGLQDRQYVTMAYQVTLPRPEATIILSDEHDDFQWVTMQELQRFSLALHTNEIVQSISPNRLADVKNDVVDKNTTKVEHLIIHTDGGSRGNPGPSAAGYVIMDESGKSLEDGGEYLGITTSNQAEYQAVRLALEQAAKYYPRVITFHIDSELVVRQMNGQYQIKNRDLWPIHARIKLLLQRYHKVSFIHVYRERNTLADAKVNSILDAHR